MPEATLFSQPTAEIKTDKARITAAMCCNASDIHKIKLWFIDSAMNSRLFKRNGIHAENLRMM